MNHKEKVKKILRRIPVVFLAMKRSDTPLLAKVLAGITVGYALSPIDLIPDFIPVLGYLDDMLILPLLITLTLKCIPPKIIEECEAEAVLERRETPKRWFYALPIVLVWLLVIWWITPTFVRCGGAS